MLQRIILILFVLILSIGGGAASVWHMLQSQEGIAALTVGDWTAFPNIGTPDADPYSKARVARDGVLSLGRAEGVRFIAQRDSSGVQLQRNCNYEIEGITPPTRFWTMFAADQSLSALAEPNRPAPAIQSQEILREPDNSFIVVFGPRPAPGNWVRVQGTGAMTILLTLYDTRIQGNSDIVDIRLPQILRTACNG